MKPPWDGGGSGENVESQGEQVKRRVQRTVEGKSAKESKEEESRGRVRRRDDKSEEKT